METSRPAPSVTIGSLRAAPSRQLHHRLTRDHGKLCCRARERLPGLAAAVHHGGYDLVAERARRAVSWNRSEQRPEIIGRRHSVRAVMGRTLLAMPEPHHYALEHHDVGRRAAGFQHANAPGDRLLALELVVEHG